jgi:hypothetical protein
MPSPTARLDDALEAGYGAHEEFRKAGADFYIERAERARKNPRGERQMIAAWRSCGPAPAEGFVTPRRHQGAVSKHAGTAPKNPWPSVPAGLATTRSNLDH